MQKKLVRSFNKFFFANICFFDAYPPQSGSGVVCWDFFQSIPSNKKRFFQLSTKKNNSNKYIKTINLFKNSPFFKIILLPQLIISIIKFFDQKKNKILIIEGPSWAFYSFFLILFFKIFMKDIKIIYRSHSIEYEIRKRNSYFLISTLTKYFEKKIYKLSDISTCVSQFEQNKINKYYNVRPYIFPNSILVDKLKKLKEKKIKNLPRKFIFFCGSYEYSPNKQAIDFIIDSVLPNLIKKNIYFVISGGCEKKFDSKYVVNLKKISKNKLKYLYLNCVALVVPLREGYGTRVKILEAIALKVNIITTIKGIEGIDYKNYKFIKIVRKMSDFSKSILFSQKHQNHSQFKYEYDMKKKTLEFFNNFLIE